jgi:hypothetical protein
VLAIESARRQNLDELGTFFAAKPLSSSRSIGVGISPP